MYMCPNECITLSTSDQLCCSNEYAHGTFYQHYKDHLVYKSGLPQNERWRWCQQMMDILGVKYLLMTLLHLD